MWRATVMQGKRAERCDDRREVRRRYCAALIALGRLMGLVSAHTVRRKEQHSGDTTRP